MWQNNRGGAIERLGEEEQLIDGGGVIEKWEEVQFIGGRWEEGQFLCEKYIHMREESGMHVLACVRVLACCRNVCVLTSGRNVCMF